MKRSPTVIRSGGILRWSTVSLLAGAGLTGCDRGYVATAPVRAGAQVRRGDVLATLDDRDLRLEQARYRSEADQAEQKYHDANARRDRTAAAQASAQQRQAQAQLDLVDEKLSRSRITAPLDGLVVSGDLTQLLGSPVEQVTRPATPGSTPVSRIAISTPRPS